MECRIIPDQARGRAPATTNAELMPARLFLSSGDLVADRRFDFARDLQLKGDLAAAADLLQQATDLAPGFASAWLRWEKFANNSASATRRLPRSAKH
jgi:ABC-type phosphate/phosphonate transport system substrate-binding protein